MTTDSISIQVDVSAKFKRNLRLLAKRYRNVRSDIQPIIKQLQRGELPGDAVSGVSYRIFKVRVRNQGVQRGKSGGYRIIYTMFKPLLELFWLRSTQNRIRKMFQLRRFKKSSRSLKRRNFTPSPPRKTPCL